MLIARWRRLVIGGGLAGSVARQCDSGRVWGARPSILPLRHGLALTCADRSAAARLWSAATRLPAAAWSPYSIAAHTSVVEFIRAAGSFAAAGVLHYAREAALWAPALTGRGADGLNERRGRRGGAAAVPGVLVIVKICGITSLDDARTAVAAGADYLGFVFYPASPRAVTPALVRAIVRDLPPGVGKVGVFVNESRETMQQVASDCGLTAVQVHGSAAPGEVTSAGGVAVWRALALRGPADLSLLAAWAGFRLVLDTATPAYGGSGRCWDWDLAARAAAGRDVLLAGGLTPANVAEAIRRVQPTGVDVSSGVECRPGVKDGELVRAFVAAVRTAA